MAGPSGRGRGRGRRGRGGRTGSATPPHSPSPAPSSSSEEEARTFDFSIVIKDDSLVIQRLPEKLGEFIVGKVSAALQLREAGRGKMYLHKGWEEFARFHNLKVGCVLTFLYLYEGDEEMRMNVFDNTSCRRNYHSEEEEDKV